jgi:competence protein ComEC
MYPWLKIPLFRAFIPFLAGILSYKYLPYISVHILFIFLSIILLYLLFSKIFISKRKGYFKIRWIDGVGFTLFFLFGGYLITHAHNQLVSDKHFSHYLNPNSVVVLKITDPPEEKSKTLKLHADVLAVKNGLNCNYVSGMVLTYIEKDSLSEKLKYGDIIAVKNSFSEISAPLNPGQFDYQKNLGNKSIHHQAFLKSNQWVFLNHGRQSEVMNFMFAIRSSFIKSIRANIQDESQQAILMALLIGYTSEINDDIRQSFTDTGIMHLLAVSGLHVGIIFLVLNLFFKGLLKLRYGNIIFIVVISIILWMYAGITGFSPSVLRATIMFNFLLIGKNIRKVNFIYNSILVSVFFLLLYDPYLIYHVGFQLSYAAVIGIVFVQPYLNSLLTTKIWVIRKLWPLISVTISAQFFTLPLILYYFSQFPVYFFISNLLIIPISTFVIYFGFVMVFFDVLGIHALTWFFTMLVKYTMELMTLIIFYIRQLPFVLIDNIYLNPLMTLILFIVILFMCYWIFYRKKRDLILFLGALVLFIISATIINFRNQKNDRVVIYAVQGQTLIGVQKHKAGYYIGDSAIIYNTKQLRMNTFRSMIASGINFRSTPRYLIKNELQNPDIFINRGLISSNSFRILCIDDSFRYNEFQPRIKVDIILITHNPFIKPDDLKNSFDFGEIVCDGSNSKRAIQKWKNFCEKSGINFYDINTQGARIIDI